MGSVRTFSVMETEILAERLGRRAQAGWVVGLSGELGAGKTAFTRGFARGLGFKGRVHSPTYALLNDYSGGRLDLHHLDLYRLGSAEEVRSAGLEEYILNPPGVTLVEWVERWTQGGAWPSGWRWVQLRVCSENEREITSDEIG